MTADEVFEQAKEVVGYAAAIELVRAWGGGDLYLPDDIAPDHPISLRIGEAEAFSLCESFGPGNIPLPSYRTILIKRRNAVIRNRASTSTQSSLASEFGLSIRQIRNILSEPDEV